MNDTGISRTDDDSAESAIPTFAPANEWGLTAKQDAWISYCAVGGLITDDDGTLKRMTVLEFCEKFAVGKSTVYDWKQIIPEFGDKVRKRRYELYPSSRETNMWNRLYMIAMASKDHKAAVQAIGMLQGHFARLELPTQRSEVDVGNNLMDLLNTARKKQIIDAQEVPNNT
jgi:hypothetical protein